MIASNPLAEGASIGEATKSRFRFTIEIVRDGSTVASLPASPAPCLEDLLFRDTVAGLVANDGRLPAYDVEPQWLDEMSAEVGGLLLAREDGSRVGYDLGVFAATARAAVRRRTERGELASGDRVAWHVRAEAVLAAPPRFRARSTREPYPLLAAALPDVARGASDVRLAAGALAALERQLLASPTTECAALLTGAVLHDPARGAFRIEVQGAVPVAAGERGASGAHFAFDPESFRRAHAEIRTAAGGEATTVGWFHSHPPCARCFERDDCTADLVFLSADDVAVQAAAFPSAFQLALVGGKVADRPATKPGFRLYAWRRGRMAEVSYRVGASDAKAGMLRQEAIDV